MPNICSPVDISNWAPFSSCSYSSPLSPSYHLPFHPTHLNIFLMDLFKHVFLATFFYKKAEKNLAHLLILLHQMISSLSCTEEERDISNEYQGCWEYQIWNKNIKWTSRLRGISKDLEISSSPFLRIAGPWPSSCFRRLHLKIRWPDDDDDDVDESDV